MRKTMDIRVKDPRESVN